MSLIKRMRSDFGNRGKSRNTLRQVFIPILSICGSSISDRNFLVETIHSSKSIVSTYCFSNFFRMIKDIISGFLIIPNFLKSFVNIISKNLTNKELANKLDGAGFKRVKEYKAKNRWKNGNKFTKSLKNE